MNRHRALITGASAGLGAEFARQLAARDLDLVLVARRADALEALGRQLVRQYGIEVEVVPADLSMPDASSKLYEALKRRDLRIDYLVNNAGAAGPDLLNDRDWPAQQRYIELMMSSVAGMCHHFIPPMRESGFGRVINVASVAGFLSLAGDTSYGPAKAYVIALSRRLAATLRPDNVLVLALCPGFTHTDFHQPTKLRRMKDATPGFIWYDASVVVREGLDALEKGRDVYVSGRLYRYLVPLLRSRFGGWLMATLGVRRRH